MKPIHLKVWMPKGLGEPEKFMTLVLIASRRRYGLIFSFLPNMFEV